MITGISLFYFSFSPFIIRKEEKKKAPTESKRQDRRENLVDEYTSLQSYMNKKHNLVTTNMLSKTSLMNNSMDNMQRNINVAESGKYLDLIKNFVKGYFRTSEISDIESIGISSVK